jgi:hypothetical protein
MTVDRFDEDRWDGYEADDVVVTLYTPVAVGHSYGDCTCETSAPDRDGNRDLFENPECPIHGAA